MHLNEENLVVDTLEKNHKQKIMKQNEMMKNLLMSLLGNTPVITKLPFFIKKN